MNDSPNRPTNVRALHFAPDFLFENVNDSIFIHDLAGNLLNVNQVACQRLGYTRDELLQMRVSDLDSPANALLYPERIDHLHRAGALILESAHRRRDGSYMPVEVNARLITGDGTPIVLSVVRDITERKRAEATLHRQAEQLAQAQAQTAHAEQQYRNLFENAVEGIFQSTPAGRYLNVNSALARIYGYASPAEMIAEIGEDIAHKIYAASTHRENFIAAVESDDAVHEFEAPHLRRDGSTVWVSTSARAVRDSAGKLLYYEGFVQDITERRRALMSLRKSEERFVAQYKGIPIPTYTWRKTPQGFVFIDYNDAASQITQGKIFESLGQRAHEIYHDEPQFISDLEACFDERTTLRREMKMRRRFSDERVDLIVSYVYIPPDLVMVHTEDVTQSKQAEAALRDSEARYRMLMEQAADGILNVDAYARILDTNSTLCAMLGYTRDEMLGKHVTDILAPGSLEAAPIPFDELRAGKTAVIERMVQRQDGTLIPIEVRTKMLPDGTFQGILRDISEHKQLEAAIQAMLESQRQWNAELETQVRAKTSELRRVSETRDQLLRELIVAQEEEHRRVARELHDETSQSLTALLANLAVAQALPPSKAKAHLNDIKTAVVEILKGVNQIVLDLRPTLLDDYGLMPALSWYANKRLGANVRVEVNSPEPELRLPATIETTLFRIGQEALANVAKHAQATHVLIDLQCDATQKQLTLQVRDNGKGFAARAVKYQIGDDRPRLGLLGMQERAQLIGGELTIVSAPGKGTAIQARVPVAGLATSE